MADFDDLISDLKDLSGMIVDNMVMNADPVIDSIRDDMEDPDNTPEHPEGYIHNPGDPTKPEDDGTRFDSGSMAEDVGVTVNGSTVSIGNRDDGDVAQGQDLGWGTLGPGAKPSGAVQDDMAGAGFYARSEPVMEDMIEKTIQETIREF
jgi:hypothetical protein